MYFIRSSPCLGHPILARFDTLARSTLSVVLNVDFSDGQWLQASLTVNSGGLGVRSVPLLAPSAFLASATGAQHLVNALLPPGVSGSVDGEAESALLCWRVLVLPDEPVPINPSSQKAWDAACVSCVFNSLIDNADMQSLSRLRAVSSRDASSWLSALLLSSIGLRMSDECCRIAVGLRLGANLCLPHTCVCGARVDSRGVHGLSCARSAGRHVRHSMLNDIICRALISAHVPASREPRGLCRSDGKRPDGVSLVPWSGGKCLVWDATVADTLAPSHMGVTATRAGAAAEKAALAKIGKYASIVGTYKFIPVAFETLGSCSLMARKFVAELGRRVSSATGNLREACYLRQRLSVAIQRGNAASVLGTIRDFNTNFNFNEFS